MDTVYNECNGEAVNKKRQQQQNVGLSDRYVPRLSDRKDVSDATVIRLVAMATGIKMTQGNFSDLVGQRLHVKMRREIVNCNVATL